MKIYQQLLQYIIHVLPSSTPTSGLSSLFSPLYVPTTSGILHGFNPHGDTSVRAFLGIPYADPPRGKNRWLPAKPFSKVTEDVREATSFGDACVQYRFKTIFDVEPGSGKDGKSENVTFLPPPPESEDCLTVNVWTPGEAKSHPKNKADRPVIIWMYGGGFQEGASGLPFYDAYDLVRQQKDVIVASFNYRVNIFGFPTHPLIKERNLGIRDQRFAIEWIRDNIASFGGDPSRMILIGQSAGANSISYYSYAYAADPIVYGLATISGQWNLQWPDFGTEFRRVAGNLGCYSNSTGDTEEELECMKNKPWQDIKHAVSDKELNVFGFSTGGSVSYDNVTVFTPEVYLRKGENGEFARLPMLIGNVDHEFDSLLEWDPIKGVNKTQSDMLTQTVYTCGAWHESLNRVKHNVTVYRYRYMPVYEPLQPFPWVRCYHGSEIPVILGNLGNETLYPGASTDKTLQAASRKFQDAVAAFARDPEDGIARLGWGWDKYDPEKKTLMKLFDGNSSDTEMVDPKLYDNCEGWDQYAIHQWDFLEEYLKAQADAGGGDGQQ